MAAVGWATAAVATVTAEAGPQGEGGGGLGDGGSGRRCSWVVSSSFVARVTAKVGINPSFLRLLCLFTAINYIVAFHTALAATVVARAPRRIRAARQRAQWGGARCLRSLR